MTDNNSPWQQETSMRPDMRRRRRAVCAASLLMTISASAGSEVRWLTAYPSRPVSLVVPNAAGGAADQLARSMAEMLGQRLGQTVIVRNVGGASGAIAARQVLHAPADGYTLLFGTTSDMVVTPLSGVGAYTALDFTAIAKLGVTPMTLVARAGLGLDDPDDLVARARRAPGGLSIGTTGSTSLQAMAAAALQRAARIDLLVVPYGGAAPMLLDLLGGRLDLAVLAMPATLDHVRAGRLSMLGLLSEQRSATAPDLPTINESRSFADVSVEIWAGLAGPPGLSLAIVQQLSHAVEAVLADEAYRLRRAQLGDIAAAYASPGHFARFLAAEHERYRSLAAGLKPE